VSVGADRSCGVTATGGAYCWGWVWFGPPTPSVAGSYQTLPLPVTGELTFASVDAGLDHACGLTTAGAAYCWGSNMAFGELGAGDIGNLVFADPQPVSGGQIFTSLTVGHYHTCAMTAAGAAYCWGSNGEGELGVGSIDVNPHAAPSPVSGALRFASVSAGYEHTCGLTPGGVAYCWGSNFYGQLGTTATLGQCAAPGDSFACSSAPVPVAGGLTFTALSAGWYHTCGIATGGAAYCWGYDWKGQLGTGDSTRQCSWAGLTFRCSPVPVPVAGELTFETLEAGATHTCGRTTAGVFYCWGDNLGGQLGTGTWSDSPRPVRVLGQP
jgi:alpha-tubulin suppressor-like RCC1 family protein